MRRRFASLAAIALAACGGSGSKINVPANDPTPPSAVALQADVPGKRLVNVTLGSAPDSMTLVGPDTVRISARADDPDGGVKAIRIWMSVGKARPGTTQNPTLAGAPAAQATSSASVGQPADVSLNTAFSLDSPKELGQAFHDLTVELYAEAENYSGGISKTAKMTLRMHAIPLRLHVIRLSDENGKHAPSVTASQFDTVVARVNRVYRGTGLRFLFDSTSDWTPRVDSMLNLDKPGASATENTIADSRPGKIVLFLRWGSVDTSRTGNGNAYPPPGAGPTPSSVSDNDQRYVSLPDLFGQGGFLDLGGGSFVGHELGHYLGLYHTFPGWSDRPGPVYNATDTTKAQADASVIAFYRNHASDIAAFDGDLLSDTPPDPGVTAWQARGANICTSSSILVTQNLAGAPVSVTFNPPLTNVMAYYDFWRCSPAGVWPPAPQVFTAQQIARMHSTLGHPKRSHLVP